MTEKSDTQGRRRKQWENTPQSREVAVNNPESHFSTTPLPLKALMISVHKLAGKRITGEENRMGPVFQESSGL